MRRASFVVLTLPLLCFGCSSASDTGSSAVDSAMDDAAMDDSSADDSAMPDDTAVADTAAAPKPAAPTITKIMPMTALVHVTWTVNNTGLTGVEVWRKDGAGAYAKVYTLAGTATTQSDKQASNTSTVYCYQIKAIKNGVASDPSNEKCGTPQ